MPRCPGQDQRYWTPDDIFDVRCPHCDNLIEFWKDEPVRVCKVCANEVSNPRIDLGCAEWCKYGEECTGKAVDREALDVPLAERLEAKLNAQCHLPPSRLEQAKRVRRAAEALLRTEDVQAHIVKVAAVMLGASLDETGKVQETFCFGTVSDQKYPSFAALLQSLALPSADVKHIEAIYQTIAADKQLETGECAIVWDAVQIVRQELIRTDFLSE